MKAFYREIKVGFVLELRQILPHTDAIFVPRGDEETRALIWKKQKNLNMKFGCLRNSVGTGSLHGTSRQTPKNSAESGLVKTGISKLEKGVGQGDSQEMSFPCCCWASNVA